MKYYIIAGEASGDIYGSQLIQKLRLIDKEADFKYWGGSRMKATSKGQIKSVKDTSFMGFLEVALNIMVIRDLFKFAKSSILEYKPDIVIFIDYPGFNLRMCEWCKGQGFKTAYYISPQLWAWKKNRYKILRDYVDLFYIILPFERDFFKNLKTPYKYFGHPLVEEVLTYKENSDLIQKIGLFPGSRQQELQKHLPIMVGFAKKHPEYSYTIAGLSHIDQKIYQTQLANGSYNIDIVYDKSHEVMNNIDVAIAASGTTTLELALYGVPQIVAYKTSKISFAIGRCLVNTKYISLVNLIAQKEIVQELLQDDFNEQLLEKAFLQLIQKNNLDKMHISYKAIRSELGNGQTSQMVAEDIYQFLLK